jgi:hypothetical protein
MIAEGGTITLKSALPAWGNAKNEDPIQNQPFVIAIPERKTL